MRLVVVAVSLCQRRTGSETNDDIGWRGTILLSHSKQIIRDESAKVSNAEKVDGLEYLMK